MVSDAWQQFPFILRIARSTLTGGVPVHNARSSGGHSTGQVRKGRCMEVHCRWRLNL